MSLLIRTIFPLQCIEKTHSLTLALTKTAFLNSSTINNSVSTLNIFTYNAYPQYIFGNKLLFIILISKIKPTTGKKKLIYFSVQIFRTPKRCTKDINIKFHHNYNPYIQMLFIQKNARLLIRPLCLMQPGCGFTARCRLGHFAYHRGNFQLFVG